MMLSVKPAGCSAACNNANITFFWRAEDYTLSNTKDCTTDDYSAGDTSFAEEGSTVEINATNVQVGSNSLTENDLDCADGGRGSATLSTSVDSIWDGGNARFAFWYYMECIDTGTQIFEANDGGATYILFYQYDDSGTSKFRLAHVDGGDNSYCLTGDISGYAAEYLWCEIEIDVTNDETSVSCKQTDGTEVLTCSDTGSTIADIGTPDDLTVLNANNTYHGDHSMDTVVISTDPNTSLWDYHDDAAYNSCS